MSERVVIATLQVPIDGDSDEDSIAYLRDLLEAHLDGVVPVESIVYSIGGNAVGGADAGYKKHRMSTDKNFTA